ncbi:hypothetical protein C6P46_003649 [Rhodotorula mucilaginosa]|uniref:Uncharacterized protein n=1 Tax=Rhodotorula mucilaginosa TaxID=5537 RepID=A0A9P7B942_RHOMI|nr:hypothetical protein C6P46_003649 [Rhodotorula mucilaginosa]
MTDTEYEDPFGAELGAFDIVADSSAATARQQRIEAARKAARSYQAKVEEPGWYNSLDPTARAKDLARLVLYSLHGKYYERRFLEVVDAGCELIAGEVKEQSEVIDLVLRAAAKCDIEPHLASLSLASARILSANSPLAVAAPSRKEDLPVSSGEVIAATLASLRLHPTLPIPQAFLACILREAGHPFLSSAISDPTLMSDDRPDAASEVEREIEQVDLIGDGEPAEGDAIVKARRDILRRVVGLPLQAELGGGAAAGSALHGDDPGAEDSRAVGRNVRSL